MIDVGTKIKLRQRAKYSFLNLHPDNEENYKRFGDGVLTVKECRQNKRVVDSVILEDGSYVNGTTSGCDALLTFYEIGSFFEIIETDVDIKSKIDNNVSQIKEIERQIESLQDQRQRLIVLNLELLKNKG